MMAIAPVTPSEFVDGRLPLARAQEIADDLAGTLAPACTRVLVAGSVRRERPWVKDIELVAEPRPERTTDDIWIRIDPFEELIARLRGGPGNLKPREVNGRGAWGERYKRASWWGAPIDLFIVRQPAQFGLLALIRTGPDTFSKRLVTSTRYGGLLPVWLKVKDGAIWHGAELVPMPEEADVWAALGIAEIPIGERR